MPDRPVSPLTAAGMRAIMTGCWPARAKVVARTATGIAGGAGRAPSRRSRRLAPRRPHEPAILRRPLGVAGRDPDSRDTPPRSLYPRTVPKGVAEERGRGADLPSGSGHRWGGSTTGPTGEGLRVGVKVRRRLAVAGRVGGGGRVSPSGSRLLAERAGGGALRGGGAEGRAGAPP